MNKIERINLLSYVKLGDCECQVLGLSFKDKVYKKKMLVEICAINSFISSWHNIDDIEPIELTDEWLKKLGFEIEKIHPGKQARKGNLCLWKGDGWANYAFMISNDQDIMDDENNFSVDLIFVHQIQNLYQVLTEQELVLNEP